MSYELMDCLGKRNLEKNRSDIERIISDYRNEWDIYTELLQNSTDAIIDKHGFKNLSKGNIKLEIFTDDRKLIITDNGIGIAEEDISKVLVNGESIKRKNNKGKYGFMGFGLTFVAFQSKYIQITSIKGGIKATRTYKDLYKYIFNNDDIPQSEEEKKNISSDETDEESGTRIIVQFPLNFPKNAIEKNLNLAFGYAGNFKVMEYILRTKSPVGLLDPIFNKNFKNFNFKLIINNEMIDIDNWYLNTREIICKLMPNEKRIYDIENEFKNFLIMTDRLPEAQKNIARKCILLDSFIENIYIGEKSSLNARLYISATSKENLNAYSENVAYSGIVDENNERLGEFKVKNGLWLAINGLPTGICLDEFEHSNYLPFSGIIDIQNKEFRSELDSGRKGITPYRANQIKEKVRQLIREIKLIKYKSYVINADTRISNPLYNPKKELDKILRVKKFYASHLNHKYFPPHEEQEVISIFTELISKEILKGYNEKILSGYQVYDGLYEYRLKPDKNVIFSQENIFGIKQEVFDKNSGVLENDILIEFKRDLEQIYKDISNNRKDLSNIDILVCWDVNINRKDIYNEIEGDILQERILENNVFYGVTHHLITGKRQQPLPIIELRTIIEKYIGEKIKEIEY